MQVQRRNLWKIWPTGAMPKTFGRLARLTALALVLTNLIWAAILTTLLVWKSVPFEFQNFSSVCSSKACLQQSWYSFFRFHSIKLSFLDFLKFGKFRKIPNVLLSLWKLLLGISELCFSWLLFVSFVCENIVTFLDEFLTTTGNTNFIFMLQFTENLINKFRKIVCNASKLKTRKLYFYYFQKRCLDFTFLNLQNSY